MEVLCRARLCCHVKAMLSRDAHVATLVGQSRCEAEICRLQGLQTNMFGISDDLREEVKKRVYLTSNVDEFNCSSGPLTGKLRKKPKNMFVGL